MRLERLDGAMVPTNLGEFYDDVAQRADGLQPLMYRNSNAERRFWRLLELAGQTPDRRTCLEIGCAEGLMTVELAKLFWRVDAMDISGVMLSRCQPVHNVAYFYGDATIWEPPTRSGYDLVVMSEVLEHVDDPVAMIRRYAGMARRIIASCPVTEPVNEIGAFDPSLLGRETRQADATGHIWYMDMDGFRSWFDGLRIVHSEIVGHSGIVICESVI